MKPLIGCASHRFALAVQDYIKGNQSVINKIQQLMVKLRGVKLSAKLRQHTNLRHVLFNATRWSSVFDMICRYREIKSILQEEMQSEANIVDLLLSPKENSEVDCLFSELKDLNSVSVALQKEKLDMSTARLLIDETAKKFPKLDPENKYLGKNARIVKNKHFETGIVKILDGKENELSLTEILQCKRLKKT